jgi:chitodextrinase
VSVSEIEMSATTATDAESPPVSYFFEFVDVQIPGGHDSGWQEDNPIYTDSGLFTNSLYGYTVRAQDAAFNETAPSDTLTAATLIETPQSAPQVLTAETSATLTTTETFTNVTLNQSGLYFDSTTPGGDGGINQWIQDTNDQATGLTPDTLYSFRFKARNQDGVETDWSPERTRRTRAAVPSAPVLSNATCESIDVAIGDDINPSYTTYAILATVTDPIDATWDGQYVGIGGNPSIDPVYQTQADWGTTTVTGLAEQTTYTFAVEARNGAGITTDLGPEASLTTEPCSAIQCGDLPSPSVCKGDVDGNGMVTPSDVGLVKFWYGDTDPANLCYYDVNCDGVINPADVGLVKFYYGACTAESEPPCWAQ